MFFALFQNETVIRVMDNGNLIAIILAVIVIAEIISIIVIKKGWDGNAIRIVGLTVIAFLGVFVYLTSDSNFEKAAPAVYGLLGTIAGFLVGKTEK